MNIPRIFHHVWVSGDEMPESVLAIRQTWIDRHPDWEFRVWRLEDLGWLRNKKLFDRSVPYSQKSDFARYEVVHRFGGVYLDTDVESFRALDPLIEGCQFFAGLEPGGYVGSAIFGATSSHRIVREMIERLPVSCYVHPTNQLGTTSGPLLLDRIIRDGHWEGRPGVRIFPPAYFYPYSYAEPLRREEPFPRAYAVHHWGHSWKGQRGVTVRPTDLLPRKGEPTLPTVRAIWREAGPVALTSATLSLRQRLVWPAKRFTKRVVERVIPSSETLHGIAWGPGEVLVAAPFGTRLLCPTDDLSIAPELALTGVYDASFVSFLERRLRLGMTFVDVGANVGLFTILAAARVGNWGRVFAYECNPELVGFLRRNIAMNWFDDRVRLIPKAAHRDDEERRFLVPRAQKMLGSLTRFDGLKEDQVGDLQEFQVACERLDVGLAEIPYIDLLKIDVEGGEAAVLDGASGLLDEGRIGAISLEYRENALREELRNEMEKQLTSLVHHRGATLHVPGDPRSIPLDEVLTVFEYTQLLIQFPEASIKP